MAQIMISGLVNTETTVPVRQFPIEYYPIDYPFFGVNTAVSGVGYNIAAALRTLGDGVKLTGMTGRDLAADAIVCSLERIGVATDHLHPCLQQTPSSVVLYDIQGRRQIYCDLKDIQDTAYDFSSLDLSDVDLVVACNINFNRPLLQLAKQAGTCIATDVHVLQDVEDGYNRDFMTYADILFLSDEAVGEDHHAMIHALAQRYDCAIIVMGRGSRGAALYQRETGEILDMPAASVGQVVNTVGAGDALFAAFVHYYAQGKTPVEALRRAQVFAACKIRQSGAANGFVTEAEVEMYL